MGQLDDDFDWISPEQALLHLRQEGILALDGGSLLISTRVELSQKTWSAISFLVDDWGFTWEWAE
jgi:hypothetical protein